MSIAYLKLSSRYKYVLFVRIAIPHYYNLERNVWNSNWLETIRSRSIIFLSHGTNRLRVTMRRIKAFYCSVTVHSKISGRPCYHCASSHRYPNALAVLQPAELCLDNMHNNSVREVAATEWFTPSCKHRSCCSSGNC